MPRLSVACVMLQRVPPLMRILTPGLRFFSRSRTRRPCSAVLIAAINPAAPAPTTTTSHTVSDIKTPRRRQGDKETRRRGDILLLANHPRFRVVDHAHKDSDDCVVGLKEFKCNVSIQIATSH